MNREDGFIADQVEGEMRQRDDHRHRMLDRQREQQKDLDLEAIAADFEARHGGRRGYSTGTVSGPTPRRLLLPDVNVDPSIWGVKCKPGKEREVVFSIMRKIEEKAQTREPLKIITAFARENSMQGYVYVEARKQSDVMNALQGITNCYPNSKGLLVPVAEMPDLLRVVKRAEILPNTWCRMKKGKYAGDLAQIEAVMENGLEVRIRIVPRIDYSKANIDDGSGKRKRPQTLSAGRPPPRLFSEQEARKATKYIQATTGPTGKRMFTFQGENYEDGYLVKDVKLNMIDTENVNPTLEEVSRFASGGEDGTESLDLSQLAASMKASLGSSGYEPGDMVEVYDGEQQGVIGQAVNVTGDIVTIRITEGDPEMVGSTVDVPFKGLRKKFSEGDHVKVTGSSRYKDEVGLVVRIVNDSVTFVSDVSLQEITVFSKDLKKADDGVAHSVGKFDLHDLVQIE